MISDYPLACPLDGLPLRGQGNGVTCDNHHHVDFCRRGTLNLLPVQFRKSRHPGDSKQMVQAREKFLSSDLYRPIANRLNTLVAAHDPHIILDAGCGEGYYTRHLADALPHVQLAGMDISKDAIQAAAKTPAAIQWLVGTNARIPVCDHTLDAVLCLFGFPVWAEFARVLKPGGILVMADAGPDHLIELRRVLYPEIKHKPSAPELLPPGFAQKQTDRLHHLVHDMTAEQRSDLIAMTPHQHRATKENIAAAVAFPYENGLTLDIVFSTYTRADI